MTQFYTSILLDGAKLSIKRIPNYKILKNAGLRATLSKVNPVTVFNNYGVIQNKDLKLTLKKIHAGSKYPYRSSSQSSCGSNADSDNDSQCGRSLAPNRERHKNLKSLTINFQSILKKKEVFWNLVDEVKPDIIFGCETWLRPEVLSGEFFPADYALYRRDRRDGYGGGSSWGFTTVLLAIKLILILMLKWWLQRFLLTNKKLLSDHFIVRLTTTWTI